MSGDVDNVVRALVENFAAPPNPVPRKEQSPVLSLLTVLLEMDRRKPGWVQAKVERLNQPEPGYGTLAAVRDYVDLMTSEKYFALELGDANGKRAKLLLPMLDALIEGLRDFEAGTEAEQAQMWAAAARPSDWTVGPFRALGLDAFQRLRILLGANAVIPTKDMRDFVGRAVGRVTDAVEAAFLVERAATRLRYDLRGAPKERWTANATSASERS